MMSMSLAPRLSLEGSRVRCQVSTSPSKIPVVAFARETYHGSGSMLHGGSFCKSQHRAKGLLSEEKRSQSAKDVGMRSTKKGSSQGIKSRFKKMSEFCAHFKKKHRSHAHGKRRRGPRGCQGVNGRTRVTGSTGRLASLVPLVLLVPPGPRALASPAVRG